MGGDNINTPRASAHVRAGCHEGFAMAVATVRITVAWWVRWYIAGVELAAKLTGAEPDMEKVGAVVRRGVKVKA